ncbi:hypothetical protein SEA_CAPTAINREX_1 [Microbacterium phage CaptainRex]|nr:hypothetical protein SEA_LIBRIE_1 [Microbacterium phage Librie]WIC89832.1 hypothetical protein SEA_CAPTAINREX_1 [Microbacterium phage CaptainRex]
MCKSHGGGTAASVRKSTRAKVTDQVHSLWGIASGTGGISVEEQLTKLARNKLADVNALRIKISADPIHLHIGRLVETIVEVEYDIQGTVQSKEGTQVTKSKRAGTSVWVQELHKAEGELLAILRLLQEVTGDSDPGDQRRVTIQAARQAARLAHAFPGLSSDEIAMEVAKGA